MLVNAFVYAFRCFFICPLVYCCFVHLSTFSFCLSPQHILQLFVQILVAIQHVHSLNILHRDLKTQNIMLNKKRSVVKIGDFGISKVLSSKITSAQTVSVQAYTRFGKNFYKSPNSWQINQTFRKNASSFSHAIDFCRM